jgi:hypothetical protein
MFFGSRKGSVSQSRRAEAATAPTTASTKLHGLRNTKRVSLKDLQTGPGPGAYHRPLEIGGVSHVIGTAKRVHDRQQSEVGPGAYEAKAFAPGIGYSMTPRRKVCKIVENFPGPGSYSPSPDKAGIMFSVGRANRVRSRQLESPGPGAYNVSRPGSSRSAL